ncbi:MAG: hypothetical protein N3C60_03990 [Calditerrivibrio sp.]|nr:hypothetical protein [Calditerrivibrio sp.]
MEKEAEIILKQLSDVATKIINTNSIEIIEELIPIYDNFFDQLITIITSNQVITKELLAGKMEELNRNVIEHLSIIKGDIQQDMVKERGKKDIAEKFKLIKNDLNLFDKKA